jgi:hypothetical protein
MLFALLLLADAWGGEEMKTLRRVARDLANECGADTGKMADVLDRTAADLRALGGKTDAVLGVIQRTVTGTVELGYFEKALDEQALGRYLNEMSEPDRAILNEHRSGKSYRAIASLLGMDKEAVLRSLVRTYADLRMRILGPNGS